MTEKEKETVAIRKAMKTVALALNDVERQMAFVAASERIAFFNAVELADEDDYALHIKSCLLFLANDLDKLSKIAAKSKESIDKKRERLMNM